MCLIPVACLADLWANSGAHRHQRTVDCYPGQGWDSRPELDPYFYHRCLEHLLQQQAGRWNLEDRKSTRLNSSHGYISYAVFCLKKKKKTYNTTHMHER